MNQASFLKPRHHPDAGFTLVELSIVLIIFSLLIGGMMMSLTSQQDLANSRETEKRMNEVRDALLGFAVVNRHLPCPADPTIANGAAGAGLEVRVAGSCNAIEGVVPWATLGVSETDSWGRRLTYRATPAFTQNDPPLNPVFTLATPGNIVIRASVGGPDLASAIPAVIVSHGTNGFRAFLPNGTQMGVTADADEQENANADTTFISKTPTPTFDDQLTWISPSILMNRMISAGRLP